MKAGVFRAQGNVAVEDVEQPRVTPDGIVLDVRACGICGSDVHFFNTGRFITPGQVMGHEFAGEVTAVGDDVAGIAVGDRVAAMPLIPCGECRACRTGAVQQCARAFAPGIGFGLPGAFAERVHIPRARAGRTVFQLPDGVGYDSGALLEPLAVAVHAVLQSGVALGETVVVLGLGPIGQLIVRVLLDAGVDQVVGVERSAFRRELAERAAIRTVAGGERLRDAVAEHLGPRPVVDVVFECTGVPPLAQGAADLVRKGGTVTIVAVYEDRAPIDVSSFAVRELTIRGSSAYRAEDFAEGLRLLATGAVVASDLVTERTPLEGLPAALARQAAGGDSMKILVEP